ncbi:alpha/beta-hydrolase [Chloropicon primus]|uniref:Alpha/beta-hydrolase n=1 Tax=Chloropicon primus TaxID=1764295 RepID=A0A5B8MQ36_9CHLO|nr:alpha/beta-hydrolase [Chloropicon primus]UPR00626.1 alpha/beta-hydrolase [Chloropicon primus]|eukprot:QDZ21412.1 alpha/beta-hydrolase [Chloropicon primus]
MRAAGASASTATGASTATVAETSFGRIRHWLGCTDVVNGLHMRELFFEVPLDYDDEKNAAAGGEEEGKKKIVVFAREVSSSRRPSDSLPYLIYLQGGPGFESPRPLDSGGWMDKACESFRVLLLDQRGTGRSTALTTASLALLDSAHDQAALLALHRADNIVRDAEAIRQCLGQKQWSTIGQSFGGFCTVTYLSMFPSSLRESFIMGGLPPTDKGCTAHKVYTHLFKRVETQNKKYYSRFPQDVEKIRQVFSYLLKKRSVETPAGNILSAKSLQSIGIRFGSAQCLESIHFMFEDPFEVTGELSYKFLRDYDSLISIDTNVIYAILHESIYCSEGGPSGWAAESVRKEYEVNECRNFDASWAIANDEPVFFTGEMVFPFMFDEVKQLRPLQEASEILAMKSDWPPLYDEGQLLRNEVRAAAAVYFEDMYVDLNLSLETAQKIKGLRVYVTNEYLHSGIRENGPKVLEKLMNMARNVEPIR